MASLRKIAAARANGAKSRGPVTIEGCRKVSFNAIRHGLSATTIVLSNESREHYQELFDTYLAHFQPDGELEYNLVENLVAVLWRQRRLWGIETGLIDVEMDRQEKEIEREFTSVDEGVRLAISVRPGFTTTTW